MADLKNIPDNDPDLKLARQYGKVLTGEQEIQDIQDPMFRMLVQARDAANESEADIPLGSADSSWQQIERNINGDSETDRAVIRPISSAKRWYWAAAAVVLIAFGSLFLLRHAVDPAPQLLAESGSAISVVELADGSSVTLRPNSRLYEVTSTDHLQSYSLNGEALFEVESNQDRTFSVEAGPGRVVVTGTRFNLSDRDERSTIHLLEGSVIFETADMTRSISLNAGEGAAIRSDYTLDEPFTFEPEEITGWTESRLIFRDRPVAEIVSELEFHYNITIRVDDESEQIALGGSVALETPEQSLQDLGTVLGGEFIQVDDQTYQFRPLP
ncbi:DUF4974 domain-containing protein [Rhodohalobacter sp. SW132]|uniref:FecR family protein n=1 Tax=Rhodohalobacter sp. SW132 TaxID=2293433 RepID=UPI000E257671|nr:FecR domain-containing protein [Rhodohalobacter sp. SW132]REL33127.1 DUF4974 domain-containing protein [Rhodohalobacter sp. SW132]